MNITLGILYNWLTGALFCLPLFVIAKALTRDWKTQRKEVLFLILACLVTGAVVCLNRSITDIFNHIIGDVALFVLVVIYLHKIKRYPLQKAIPLLFFSLMLLVAAELTVIIAAALFLGIPIMLAFSTHLSYAIPICFAAENIPLIVPLYLVTAIFTALLLRFSSKVRQTINQSAFLQKMLLFVSVLALVIFELITNLWRVVQAYVEDMPSTIPIAIVLLCIFFVVTVLFAISALGKFEQKQKEIEQGNLQYYVNELERQQISIRKFRHDYQNLILSMQAFMHDEDWEGLKGFYFSAVDAASAAISESVTTFDQLHKMKVREVKGIIASKLMMAQNVNAAVRADFEANQEIDSIPIDTVMLVRMLGIILDNAVEAVAELDKANLLICCLKWERGITFIVKNTCSPDIPPLDQLWKAGVSTKGCGRGEGLSILSELIDACPNVTLGTSVENGTFCQELLIEFEEGRKEGEVT